MVHCKLSLFPTINKSNTQNNLIIDQIKYPLISFSLQNHINRLLLRLHFNIVTLSLYLKCTFSNSNPKFPLMISLSLTLHPLNKEYIYSTMCSPLTMTWHIKGRARDWASCYSPSTSHGTAGFKIQNSIVYYFFKFFIVSKTSKKFCIALFWFY